MRSHLIKNVVESRDILFRSFEESRKVVNAPFGIGAASNIPEWSIARDRFPIAAQMWMCRFPAREGRTSQLECSVSRIHGWNAHDIAIEIEEIWFGIKVMACECQDR